MRLGGSIVEGAELCRSLAYEERRGARLGRELVGAPVLRGVNMNLVAVDESGGGRDGIRKRREGALDDSDEYC